MAERIPEQFISDLMTRVDIVEVIDTLVPLRRAGSNLVARCPFHEEKTPSFTVSPEKQFYHCFGCGAHGTAIGFLMNYEHLTFIEAVYDLAARAGLQVPKHGSEPGTDHGAVKEHYALLEQVSHYYERELRENPEAKSAVNYLKHRGLTGEIAKQFNIGFAPSGWDSVLRAFATTPALKRQLVETGILIERENTRCYDRFRNRIMFPIRNQRGRVIGFGGRTLGDDTAKYLNSPDSDVFHKGHELYGLYEARRQHQRLEQLVVVEGYMDVVALAQYGLTYSVATLGTAATPFHLERLYRTTSEVVFCFDGDPAGREAAWRAAQHAMTMMKEGRQARFMFLPEGDDPDTLIRRAGRSHFEAHISKAIPLSTFFFERLTQQTDTTSVDGRARLVELARPTLSKMPDGIFKHMMLKELAEHAGVELTPLTKILGGHNDLGKANRAPPTRGKKSSGLGLSPVRLAIALLLQHPRLAEKAQNIGGLDSSSIPGTKLLTELLETLKQNPHLSTGAILELWRNKEEGRHLLKLAKWNILTPEEGIKAEFFGSLNIINSLIKEQRMESLISKSLDQLTSDERSELAELTKGLAIGKTYRHENR